MGKIDLVWASQYDSWLLGESGKGSSEPFFLDALNIRMIFNAEQPSDTHDGWSRVMVLYS